MSAYSGASYPSPMPAPPRNGPLTYLSPLLIACPTLISRCSSPTSSSHLCLLLSVVSFPTLNLFQVQYPTLIPSCQVTLLRNGSHSLSALFWGFLLMSSLTVRTP